MECMRLATAVVLITFENEQAFSIYAIAAIRVLILTGARRSEIETLRWDNIDFATEKIDWPIPSLDRVSSKRRRPSGRYFSV